MPGKQSALDTLCVHAGAHPDPLTGAVMAPVYMTSTYAQEAPGRHKGYEYSRTKNPTRDRLEEALAKLEGARHGMAFASGLAAEDAVLRTLDPGDEVLAGQDLYGGTYRLMRQVWERFGITFKFANAADSVGFRREISPRTRLIWIETPSNPLLSIADIAAIATAAKNTANRALVLVDNTFATPALQRPLSLGADLVLHSTTKYIGGHSDVVGGAIGLSDDALAEKLRFLQNAAGAVPGPMDCFLLLRGIKTLALRMERHGRNALNVAKFLNGHSKVRKVFYPGLPGDPGRAVASRQMGGFGGMVSFEIKGGARFADRFFRKLKVFTVGESLGGVESLACYPWVMTHASIPEEIRLKAGVTAGLIRLSVGIEGGADLIADLEKALK